jgi:membrane associated rhomboid family serine protease
MRHASKYRTASRQSFRASNPSQSEFSQQVYLLGGLVALMWAIELVDTLLLGGMLDHWGIQPRTISGLPGILFAPLLHGGLPHLISNTVPFAVLGWLVLAEDFDEWLVVSIVAGLVSGLGTWVFGAANSVHIGASGIVFGYFGFLASRAWFERNFKSIVIAGMTISLFGGIIWGVLPGKVGISWEGHLFGLIGGILAAKGIAWIKAATDAPNE